MADILYDKLLRSLVRGRDSEANYDTVREELWAEVQSDPDKYLKMFFHNWFTNNWTRPIKETTASRVRGATAHLPRKPETEAEAKVRRKRDANLIGLTLMNSYLSDGETRLKDATGKQIRQEIGWLGRIAKYVKPNEIVGRKLTAKQLANLKEQAT